MSKNQKENRFICESHVYFVLFNKQAVRVPIGI